GVGKRLRLLFRTRLPYTLGFDVQVTGVQPPSRLEARAAGELDGTGRWTLTSADGGTPGPLRLGCPHHQAVDELAGVGCPAGVQVEP
ncbi:MAG TPA: hypothetical protein VGD83_37655, partial [Streptosporangiaceae bacterium]